MTASGAREGQASVGFLRQLPAFIRLGRPLFLLGGVLYHALGAALAYYEGAAISLRALILGQIAITAVQWMTHYANDYFDLEADRLNSHATPWSGSSQVLPAGSIAPRAAQVTAWIFAGIALLMLPVLALTLKSGIIPLLLIAAGLALAWFYSAPPLRLNWRGRGEITVPVVVPGLTVLVGYSLQTGSVSRLALLSVIPLLFLQFAAQLNLNAPDAEGDAAAGKRTLYLVVGPRWAARLHGLALALAYGSLPLLARIALPETAALLVAPTGLVALWQGWRVARGAYENPGQWESVAFWGLGQPVAAALMQLLAYTRLVDLLIPYWWRLF